MLKLLIERYLAYLISHKRDATSMTRPYFIEVCFAVVRLTCCVVG